MSETNTTRQPEVSAIPDYRRVPLNRLASATDETLRRIIPAQEETRVLVAAFNASL